MVSRAQENTKIVLPRFVSGVGGVLECYFRGVYCEAKRRADKMLGTYPEETWEKSVIEALDCWMTDWDGLKAARFLRTESTEDIGSLQGNDAHALFQAFYTHVFVALLCCRETRNPSALAKADSAAKRANQLAPQLQRAISDLPEEKRPLKRVTGFFPRPWCASWFRAVAKTSLGRRSEALMEYKQAYAGLAKSVEEGLRLEGDGGRATPMRKRLPPGAEISRYEALHQLFSRDEGFYHLFFRHEAIYQPIVARFFHDLAMFLAEEGDWGYDPTDESRTQGGARTFLNLAVELMNGGPEMENPYVRAGRGAFYSFARREGEALQELFLAFSVLEKERADWASRGLGNNFYASGRIYFQVGLLAYKYLRDEIKFTEGPKAGQVHVERIRGLEDRLRELSASKDSNIHGSDFLACFQKNNMTEALSAMRKILARACDYYLRIRNPFKALSAIVLMADPLQPVRDELERRKAAARRLLWELSYGMGGDLTSTLLGYENLVALHFGLPWLGSGEA